MLILGFGATKFDKKIAIFSPYDACRPFSLNLYGADMRVISRLWVTYTVLATRGLIMASSHQQLTVKQCHQKVTVCVPANTKRWTNADLMLGQRRRRWTNIKSALVRCILFAGMLLKMLHLKQIIVSPTRSNWNHLKLAMTVDLQLQVIWIKNIQNLRHNNY